MLTIICRLSSYHHPIGQYRKEDVSGDLMKSITNNKVLKIWFFIQLLILPLCTKSLSDLELSLSTMTEAPWCLLMWIFYYLLPLMWDHVNSVGLSSEWECEVLVCYVIWLICQPRSFRNGFYVLILWAVLPPASFHSKKKKKERDLLWPLQVQNTVFIPRCHFFIFAEC